MPLPLETTPVAPNALYAPQIALTTSIVNGQIVTSANIVLQAARCDANGVWENTGGRTEMVHIPNIFVLEPDIAAYSTDVQTLFGAIVTLIGNINSVRKVL